MDILKDKDSLKKKMPNGRSKLASVLQASKDFVSIDTTMKALGIKRSEAARVLVRWANQGLIKRIKNGIYVPVSLASFGAEQVIEDPWLLVPEIFSPGYIGGWSAAEHWGLTEQLFRGICVLTSKPIRKRNNNLQGISFVVKQIDAKKLFGLKPVWHSQTKVLVSSPSRTLVDMLDDPSLGGGIRHVYECLNRFLKESKTEQREIIDQAKQFDNGAIFKRIGFLLSLIPGNEELSEECTKYITEGIAKLDPSLKCDRLISKWHLWIPKNWKEGIK